MKNVFLDLDNTIISSISKDEQREGDSDRFKHFRHTNMDGYYDVFERPGLQPFLDFLFANFKVSVWTAASKSYALFIIEEFILKNHPERRIDYILFSYHCKKSNKLYKSQKNLKILNNWSQRYNIADTIIIDDHPEVKNAQPNNCIQIHKFDFQDPQSHKDRELRKIIPQLELFRRESRQPQVKDPPPTRT